MLSNSTLDTASYEFRIVTTFSAASAMLLCCVFGLFGNIISAVIFLHPLMQSPINVLLAGLSLIDLLMILLSIVVLIVPSLNLLLQNAHLWKAYSFTTIFLYPLCTAAHTSSIWTFVLVSVERYNATCRPLKPHKLLTCRQARIAQTCVVVLALCYNSVRIWEYKDSSTSNESISVVEPYLRLRRDYFISYYTVLYIITHFAFPFATILVLNIFIVRSLRYTRRYMNYRTTSASPGRQNRQIKQQRKTTSMIVVITLMFAACNTCPFILNIWEAMDPALFYGQWKSTAYLALDLSNTFVLANSSVTFFIYFAYCRRYRVLFRYFLKCICWWRDDTVDRCDLISDPSFRRYSIVTNSLHEGGGVEASLVAYNFIIRGNFNNRRRSSSMDVSSLRLTDASGRRSDRSPREMTIASFTYTAQFRSRVFTQ